MWTNEYVLGPNEPLIGKSESRYMLNTPALILDLNALEHNINWLSNFSKQHDLPVRPSGKVHKCSNIAKWQIEAGAIGINCATLNEAETFVNKGVPGVMLFTSVINEQKLRRLVKVNSIAKDFFLVIDNDVIINRLNDLLEDHGKNLNVLIEYEVGLGRTGILDSKHLKDLALKISNSKYLNFCGIHAYSVGIEEINNEIRITSKYEDRKTASIEIGEKVTEALSVLEDIGIDSRIITGGSTSTINIDAEMQLYTENQAGSYVFMDTFYSNVDILPDKRSPFKYSLFVSTSIISRNANSFAITDAGIKEFAGNENQIVVSSVANTKLSYSLVGDDMGRIDNISKLDKFNVGDSIECIPPISYSTLHLYPVFHCVRDDVLVDIWPVDARESW